LEKSDGAESDADAKSKGSPKKEDDDEEDKEEKGEQEDEDSEESMGSSDEGSEEEDEHAAGPTDADDFEDLSDSEDSGEESSESESESSGDAEEAVDDESAPDTVTTVSNEVDVASDFDIHDVERQPAQVIPEPPWAGMGAQIGKLAVALLLPLFLVMLVLYGVYKFLQVSAEFFFDAFTVGTKFLWLLIRLVFSPFLIIYHLFVPSYIKKHVDATYDQYIGRRVRKLIRVKRFIVHTILDIPFVALSCALSFRDTFVFPARDGCKKYSWMFAGRHIYKYLMTPLYVYHINRTAKLKRKNVDNARKDHDVRAARLRFQKQARKRKKMQHERAKKMRAKDKGEVQVELALPGQEAHGHQKVTLKDKKPTDLFSRTMIVERRYAVFVGFFWSMIGMIMVIILLDGQEGERCEICVHNEDVGVMICKHGIGRDCAFRLHRFELMVAVGVLSMGNIVMIYTTFLYRPHEGALRAAEQERADKAAAKEARAGQIKKEKDPDTAAIEILKEKVREPTIPRLIRRIYRHLPCWYVQMCCSTMANGPLKKMYRYERRKRMAARSIKFTQRFTAWVERQIIDVEAREAEEKQKMKEHLEQHGIHATAAGTTAADFGKGGTLVPTLTRRAAGTSLNLGRLQYESHSRFFRCVGLVCLPVLFPLGKLCLLIGKTPCGRCISRQFDRCPNFKQSCVSMLGIKEKEKEYDPFGANMRGMDGRGGPSTLEDVMERFGFKIENSDDEDEDETKTETEQERIMRLRAERPDPLGHVESQRDGGGKDDIAEADDLEPSAAELSVSQHEDLMHLADAPVEEISDKGEDEEEEMGAADPVVDLSAIAPEWGGAVTLTVDPEIAPVAAVPKKVSVAPAADTDSDNESYESGKV